MSLQTYNNYEHHISRDHLGSLNTLRVRPQVVSLCLFVNQDLPAMKIP